jgi:hypothetical protein
MKEEYFDSLRKLPVGDWRTIAWFHRIIMNYKKMKRLADKHKVSARGGSAKG